MLVPPAPWVNPHSGGHILTPACMMRGHDFRWGVMEQVLANASYKAMPQVIHHSLCLWLSIPQLLQFWCYKLERAVPEGY